MLKVLKTLLAVVLMTGMVGTFYGCSGNDFEDAVEDTGDAIKDTADDAGDAIEDAVD